MNDLSRVYLPFPFDNNFVTQDGHLYHEYKQSGRCKLHKYIFNDSGRVISYVYGTSGEVKKVTLKIEIAKAYVPNPNDYKFVECIDGDETNLHANNLRWVEKRQGGNYRYPKRGKPVICIETNQRFNSGYSAAHVIGCSPTRIAQVVKSGGTVHGLHFVRESL